MTILLEILYPIHDSIEKILRELTRLDAPMFSDLDKIRIDVWQAHDSLERVIIKEQSKLTEEELDKE